jgi:hypothetical protein
VLAEALRRDGDLDGAEREIPDPDYKASFLERVPENARTLALAGAWLGDPDDSDRG